MEPLDIKGQQEIGDKGGREMMEDKEFQLLEKLLRKYRDDESVDREEWDKRESLRFDVAFECEVRGIPLEGAK